MLGMSVKGIDEPEEKFSQIEHTLREVIIKNGGSISHHHGVGKLRKDFLPSTLSKTSMHLVQDLNLALEPQIIFGAKNGILAK